MYLPHPQIQPDYAIFVIFVSSSQRELHITGIYRLHEGHLNFPSLCVFILLHLDVDRHLVEYGNLNVLASWPRRCYRESVVVRIKFRLALERDQTFDAQSTCRIGLITPLSGRRKGMTDFETNTLSPFRKVRMTNASSVTLVP
jgi:hypothetical protein